MSLLMEALKKAGEAKTTKDSNKNFELVRQGTEAPFATKATGSEPYSDPLADRDILEWEDGVLSEYREEPVRTSEDYHTEFDEKILAKVSEELEKTGDSTEEITQQVDDIIETYSPEEWEKELFVDFEEIDKDSTTRLAEKQEPSEEFTAVQEEIPTNELPITVAAVDFPLQESVVEETSLEQPTELPLIEEKTVVSPLTEQEEGLEWDEALRPDFPQSLEPALEPVVQEESVLTQESTFSIDEKDHQETANQKTAEHVLEASARQLPKRTKWIYGIATVVFMGTAAMGVYYYYVSTSSSILLVDVTKQPKGINITSVSPADSTPALTETTVQSIETTSPDLSATQAENAKSKGKPTTVAQTAPSQSVVNESSSVQQQPVVVETTPTEKSNTQLPVEEAAIKIATQRKENEAIQQLATSKPNDKVTTPKPQQSSPRRESAAIQSTPPRQNIEKESVKESVTVQSTPPQQNVERGSVIAEPSANKFSTGYVLPPSLQEPTGMKILRKTTPQPTNRELAEAYQAFQQGNDTLARSFYEKVLQQEPKNRDALLGMAATALRGGYEEEAKYYYQKVLGLYPQDALAQVGLSSLEGHSTPQNKESKLKFLLQQSPDAAYIHFELGNLYAHQKRWTEAQQAYFEAYRLHNQQPDYAYNLAISLDQLNQSRLALTYYQEAIRLVQNKASPAYHFDLQAINRRVQTLRTHAVDGALANLPSQVR